MRRRGDDLPDVLAQWAQALWDASEVVPVHRRAELLSRAADRAASSVRLQKVAVPDSNLAGSMRQEEAWQQGSSSSLDCR